MQPLFYRLMFFLIFSLLQLGFSNPTLAALISGTILDSQAKPVENAVIILQKITGDKEGKQKPDQIKYSNNEGNFEFEVGTQPCEYRLSVYKNGKIRDKKVDFRGQNEQRQIKLNNKYYDFFINNKVIDKIWMFISPIISFFLGFFSYAFLEKRKIKKLQKNITDIYNDSLDEFYEEVNGLKEDEISDEKKYFVIEEKYNLARNNLENLISYSWAVERMKPSFFNILQKKHHIIKRMGKTTPFDPQKNVVIKLRFIYNSRHNPAAIHEEFNRLYEALKIT